MAMDPWGAKLMLMACLSASLGGCDRSANSHLAGGAAPTAAQSSRGVPTGAAISATWTDKTIPARWDPTVSVDDAWAELQAAVVTPLSEQLPGTLAAELRSNLRARFRSDISDLAVEQAVRGDWISLRTQAWNHGPMIGFRGMGRAGPIDLPQTLPTTGFTANLNPEQEWAQVRFAREMLRRLADLHAENFESWIGPALPPAGIDPDATQARVWKQGLCLHLTNQILEPWSWTDLDDLARLAPDGRISTNERQLLKDYMIRCVEDEWSQYLYEATVSRMLTWSGWSDEERRDVSRRALRGLFLVGNIHPPPSGCGRTVRYLHRLIRLDDGIEVEALWWVQNHWLSKGQVHQSALKLLIDRDDCRATELLRSLREGLPPVSGDESPELTFQRQQLDSAIAKAHRAGASSDELLAMIAENPEGSGAWGYGAGDGWRTEIAGRLLKRGVPSKRIADAFQRFSDKFDDTLPPQSPWSRTRRSLSMLKGSLMHMKVVDNSFWPDVQRFGPMFPRLED